MPISESDYSYDESTNDHYDLDHHSNTPSSTTSTRMMSKAELRKTHKPIMEKRRRAKINNCLNEIKDLILSAMKKDPERHSKLEKADILEMAVKHLKSVQKQQKDIAIRTDPTLALKYKSGYLECASEVSSYVDQIEGVDSGLKQRLSNHLNKCANSAERPQQFDFASSSLLASFAAQSRFNQHDDQNNNGGRSLPTVQGIELIPSCLPNGDFAFLLPKSSFSSILSSSGGAGASNVENATSAHSVSAERAERSERPSAFVTVMPRPHGGLLTLAKPISPPVSPPEAPKVAVIKPKAEKLVPPPHDKIHSIKFPINTIAGNSSAGHAQHDYKKEHEPLCIITNAGERYRQAQRVDESRHQEENRHFGAVGSGLSQLNANRSPNQTRHPLKRKADGLLTVAPRKYARIDLEDVAPVLAAAPPLVPGVSASAFKSVIKPAIYECISDDESDMNASREGRPDEDGDDRNESMWRPW